MNRLRNSKNTRCSQLVNSLGCRQASSTDGLYNEPAWLIDAVCFPETRGWNTSTALKPVCTFTHWWSLSRCPSCISGKAVHRHWSNPTPHLASSLFILHVWMTGRAVNQLHHYCPWWHVHSEEHYSEPAVFCRLMDSVHLYFWGTLLFERVPPCYQLINCKFFLQLFLLWTSDRSNPTSQLFVRWCCRHTQNQLVFFLKW